MGNLTAEAEARKAAKDLWGQGDYTRIEGTEGDGAYYYDQSGNVFVAKAYGGLERVTDPWTKRYRDIANKKRADREVADYDKEVSGFVDRSTQGFRTVSELEGARQAGAVQAVAGLQGQRRGLGDEYTAALSNEAATRLRSQVLDANLTFDQRLRLYAEGERLGFLKGTVNFYRNIYADDLRLERQKELARFNAKLQADYQSQGLFGDMLGNLFTVLGLAIAGPVGAVAGNAIGSATTSYSDYDNMG
jgi:hypothetical protein